MSQIVFDATTHVYFISDADGGIDDVDAPTEGEIASGTEVTDYVTKDGLSFGATNNRVAVGSLATLFAGELMGTYGYQASLKCFRDDEDDAAWQLFTHKLRGYLVVVPFGAAEADAVAHVFDVECGQRELQNSAENERQTFMLPFAVPTAPGLDAVIVAGS